MCVICSVNPTSTTSARRQSRRQTLTLKSPVLAEVNSNHVTTRKNCLSLINVWINKNAQIGVGAKRSLGCGRHYSTTVRNIQLWIIVGWANKATVCVQRQQQQQQQQQRPNAHKQQPCSVYNPEGKNRVLLIIVRSRTKTWLSCMSSNRAGRAL